MIEVLGIKYACQFGLKKSQIYNARDNNWDIVLLFADCSMSSREVGNVKYHKTLMVVNG